MGLEGLPLGWSYVQNQTFLHQAAPDVVREEYGVGLPDVETEAAIRTVCPEAAIWGPSQISEFFRRWRVWGALLPDSEVSDPTLFACTYEGDLRVTKEKMVRFWMPDGPRDNPANWRQALQVMAFSEASQSWIFPQASGTDITIWWRREDGGYEYSISWGDWWERHWKIVSATVALVASCVGTVATLGAMGPAVIGAAALVAALAAGIPAIVDGAKRGDYRAVLDAVAAIGKAAGPLAKAAFKELAEKHPDAAKFFEGPAQQVAKVYETGARSVVELAASARKVAALVPQVRPEDMASARDILGATGRHFWDEAAKLDVRDLADYAATRVPWYAQDIIRMQVALRVAQDEQGILATHRIGSSRGVLLDVIQAEQQAKKAAQIARPVVALNVVALPFTSKPQIGHSAELEANAEGAGTKTAGGGAVLALGAAAIAGLALLRRR